ncbi:MAG: phosphopyruvate hydratase, partial [Bryobacteraceae bacterium]|nr:phosphopyruvate hydratase [Bryobacteraceae bacterium]
MVRSVDVQTLCRTSARAHGRQVPGRIHSRRASEKRHPEVCFEPDSSAARDSGRTSRTESRLPLTVVSLQGLEILDSRGRPTIEVTANLSDGSSASAQVPSGASTGKHEALELRDGDPDRYGGFGVLQAVDNVNSRISRAVRGMNAEALQELDGLMIQLDGTSNKSNLGANAILAVSCAVARALSVARQEPLWRTLASQFKSLWTAAIPRPMVNILSGGLHAGHNIEIQDFLLVPLRFDRFSDALRAVTAVHAAAREILSDRGLLVTGVADEGGWGPLFPSNEEALSILTEAIERARFRPGEDCGIAIDLAASHFHADGKYQLQSESRSLATDEWIALLESWVQRYPVVSLEDGLDQDDEEGWKSLTSRLGDKVQIIGDDLFATNPERVKRGISGNSANSVLVKMNQIGTLTETFEVVNLAASAGWRAVVSARSGETEDSFLADLATATGAGQIKVGSITRSERLSKYNRLL